MEEPVIEWGQIDEDELQVWLEETYDPDFDVDYFEDVRGLGYEEEDEFGNITDYSVTEHPE